MMRSTVGLCVLSLLCLHSAIYVQCTSHDTPMITVVESRLDGPDGSDEVHSVFCDDKDVEKAAMNALDKFDENVVVGHKLAAYQVLSASKSQKNGSVYWVKFSARRTDCPAGSDKHWKECNFLHEENKSPILCNATVKMTETETETTEVACELEDPITFDRAPCLGCPEDIDEDSEDLKLPLSISISKFNSMSNSTHLFTLNSVGQATRQVVAGLRFKMSFDMRKSTCAKSEHKELHDLCVPNKDDVELAYCNSTVDMAPWRHEVPNAHIECDSGALPPMLFSRRRPAGWSPLRNLFLEVPIPTTPSPPFSTPSPSEDSDKEESSEEDMATSAPPSSASSDVPDVPYVPYIPTWPPSVLEILRAKPLDPFHCPGKPWKPLIPLEVTSAAPTLAMDPVSHAPTAEGVFDDEDLLGA